MTKLFKQLPLPSDWKEEWFIDRVAFAERHTKHELIKADILSSYGWTIRDEKTIVYFDSLVTWLPIVPFFLVFHERGHANGIRLDCLRKNCIMSVYKDPLTWAKIVVAGIWRGDWLCPDCASQLTCGR